MARRIDLIVNRTARVYQRRPHALDRVAEVARGRCRMHVTESLSELSEVTADIATRGSELVLLSGGDGSLTAGVSALSRRFDGAEMPPIAPIPGGTAGTVARNWGIAGSPDRCLARMLGRPVRLARRPSLRVRDDGDDSIGFIFGTGLVARFFRLYYDRGAPGYRGSALMAARIFVESFAGGPMASRVLDPLPCSLEVDGVPQPHPAWSLVCCSVVRDLGLHLIVNHRAGEDPARPHLVATAMPPRELGPRAPRVLRGKPLGGPDDVDRLVQRFSVAFPTPGPYVLDGELRETARVEVTAGPHLRVALPA